MPTAAAPPADRRGSGHIPPSPPRVPPSRRRRPARPPARDRAARCRGSAPAARWPHQALRHDHPADAPAGHAVIFRERVDHDRVVVGRQSRRCRPRVGQAMIDLVRNEPEAQSATGLAEFGAGHCGRSWCPRDLPGSWQECRGRAFPHEPFSTASAVMIHPSALVSGIVTGSRPSASRILR